MRIALSIHSGRAAVGEIGSSDPPAVMAIGEAVDVANELREAAVAHDLPFAISEQVYKAAGIVPSCQQNKMSNRISLFIFYGVYNELWYFFFALLYKFNVFFIIPVKN